MTVSSHLLCTITGLVAGVALTVYALGQGVFRPNDDDDDDGNDKNKIQTHPETALNRGIFRAISKVERENFLTGLLAQLWTHVNAAGCDILRESVESESLQFTHLDLGPTPLRMQDIVVREKTKDAVHFEADVVWDADDCDLRLRQKRVGSFGVSKIRFRGRMTFCLRPLTDAMPLVEAVQYSFLDPPEVDLEYTGLAQLADMKLLSNKVKETMAETIASKVVLPNRKLAVQMNEATSFLDIYQPPVGVVRITLLRGRGFVLEKRGPLLKDDIPDVYCNITVGASPIWQTSVVKNSFTPVWPKTEVADFVLYDYGQHLTVHAWDRDQGVADPDDDLGKARLPIRRILLEATTGAIDLPLLQDTEDTGAAIRIQCQLLPLSSVNVTSLSAATPQPSPQTMRGLLTILIGRATNIPEQYWAEGTYVQVTCGIQIFQTDTWPASTPTYNAAFHVPILEHTTALDHIEMKVFHAATKKPKALGQVCVSYAHLLENPSVSEFTTIGNGITLEYRATLQGLDTAPFAKEEKAVAVAPEMTALAKSERIPPTQETAVTTTTTTTASDSAAQRAKSLPKLRGRSLPTTDDEAMEEEWSFDEEDTTPSRTIRLTAVQGRGFKIQKQRLFRKADIPDVYLLIKVGTKNPQWRTTTIDDNCNPVWNDSMSFPVTNHYDTISVEAWDRDSGKRSTDDFLGQAEVSIGKLLLSAGGERELELLVDGKPTQSFVTLKCVNEKVHLEV